MIDGASFEYTRTFFKLITSYFHHRNNLNEFFVQNYHINSLFLFSTFNDVSIDLPVKNAASSPRSPLLKDSTLFANLSDPDKSSFACFYPGVFRQLKTFQLSSYLCINGWVYVARLQTTTRITSTKKHFAASLVILSPNCLHHVAVALFDIILGPNK